MSAVILAGRARGAARATLSALALVVSCRVAAGCAADPGDPLKGAAGDLASGDDGVSPVETSSGGGAVAVGSDAATAGGDAEGVTTDEDAATVVTPVLEAGFTSAADADAAAMTSDAAPPDGFRVPREHPVELPRLRDAERER